MSSDIEIVVGAKDQASAILNQVSQDVRQLAMRTQQTANTTVKASKRMEVAFNAVKMSAGPLLAVFAAVKAVTAGFRSVGAAADAFDTQAEAVRGLTRALDLSGEATKTAMAAGGSLNEIQSRASEILKQTMADHQAFASRLQETANVGDEVTLGLMRQASMLGVSSDKLQDVAAATVGLAEATGQGLPEALKKVNEAMNGNASALQEYLPSLRNLTTEQEKLDAVMAIAQKGLAQAADRANTAEGSATRLSNSFGDLLEVLGEALTPLRVLINNGLNELVVMLQSAVRPAIDMFTSMIRYMQPTFDLVRTIVRSATEVFGVFLQAVQNVSQSITRSLSGFHAGLASMLDGVHAAIVSARNNVIKAITFIEVALTNLPEVWALVKAKTQLAIESMSETVRHGFTVAIPGFAKWLGTNLPNLLQDAFIAAATIAKNGIVKINQLFQLLGTMVGDSMMFLQNDVPRMIGNLFAAMVRKAMALAPKLVSVFSETFGAIQKVFQGKGSNVVLNLGAKLQQLGVEAVRGIDASAQEHQSYGDRLRQILSGSLLDGFEATTAPLPDLLTRSLTDRERALMATISELSGKLGAEFKEKFQRRIADLNANIDGEVKSKIDLSLSGNTDAIKEAAKQQTQGLQAVASRLLTRGRSEDIQRRVADGINASNGILRRIAENTKTKPKTEVQVSIGAFRPAGVMG